MLKIFENFHCLWDGSMKQEAEFANGRYSKHPFRWLRFMAVTLIFYLLPLGCPKIGVKLLNARWSKEK